MKVMTETDDGFEVSRRDLELRGPGDFFGTKQSGLPEFRVADMCPTLRCWSKARDDAAELVRDRTFGRRRLHAAARISAARASA